MAIPRPVPSPHPFLMRSPITKTMMANPWRHLTSLGVCWSHWLELFSTTSTEDYITVATDRSLTLKDGLKTDVYVRAMGWGLQKALCVQNTVQMPRKEHWQLWSLFLLPEENFVKEGCLAEAELWQGQNAEHAQHRDELRPLAKLS